MRTFLVIFFGISLISFIYLEKANTPSPYFPRLEPSLKTVVFNKFKVNNRLSNVFIGSSIADMGFDVMAYDQSLCNETSNFKSFNFGINGAGTKVFHDILEKIIFKRTNPELIIYGISPIEFNNNSKIFLKDQENFLSSRGLRLSQGLYTFENICNAYIFKSCSLVQLSELFWPNILLDQDERFPFQKLTWLNTKNFKEEFHGQQRIVEEYLRDQIKKWPKEADERYNNLFFNFEINQEALDNLVKIKKMCDKNKCKLIVVNMPRFDQLGKLQNTNFYNIFHLNQNEFSKYDQKITDVCVQQDIFLCNFTSIFRDHENYFGDPFHLNQQGANQLAKRLAHFEYEKNYNTK
jgi:hypothetical protein